MSLSIMKGSSGDAGFMALWKRIIPTSGNSGTVSTIHLVLFLFSEHLQEWIPNSKVSVWCLQKSQKEIPFQ